MNLECISETLKDTLGVFSNDILIKIDEAHNGVEAVELTLASANKNDHYDLIFMDLHMPGYDGYMAT
jgi:CheY-like chemotaxis protein